MSQSVGRVAPWSMLNDADKAEAIRLLAQGYSYKKTAQILGRTLPQLHTWLQVDPAFRAAVLALNTERDHEALEFRERVRLAAGTMLDSLMEVATSGKQERDRVSASATFFREVYQPHHAPRAAQATAAPQVIINAAQAAVLFDSPASSPIASAPAPGTSVPPVDHTSSTVDAPDPSALPSSSSPAPLVPGSLPSSSVLSSEASFGPPGFISRSVSPPNGAPPNGAPLNGHTTEGSGHTATLPQGRAEGDQASAAQAHEDTTATPVSGDSFSFTIEERASQHGRPRRVVRSTAVTQ